MITEQNTKLLWSAIINMLIVNINVYIALFVDAYSNQQLVYQWQNSQSVNFVPGMTLSQFDLISFPYRNFTFTRREGNSKVIHTRS